MGPPEVPVEFLLAPISSSIESYAILNAYMILLSNGFPVQVLLELRPPIIGLTGP